LDLFSCRMAECLQSAKFYHLGNVSIQPCSTESCRSAIHSIPVIEPHTKISSNALGPNDKKASKPGGDQSLGTNQYDVA
jgi:hypothetical protein